jgi:hypothetical protein
MKERLETLTFNTFNGEKNVIYNVPTMTNGEEMYYKDSVTSQISKIVKVMNAEGLTEFDYSSFN